MNKLSALRELCEINFEQRVLNLIQHLPQSPALLGYTLRVSVEEIETAVFELRRDGVRIVKNDTGDYVIAASDAEAKRLIRREMIPELVAAQEAYWGVYEGCSYRGKL